MAGKLHSITKPMRIKGDHKPSECNHRLHGQYIHYKPKRATEGKLMVKVYNTDGDRDLIVPNPNPLDIPGIIPQSEFERLVHQGHVVTKQDKLDILAKNEEEKLRLQRESEMRKEKLAKMQKVQSLKGGKLGKVEDDASAKNLYLLQRAQELRQEQEDDVKKLNSVILEAKCMVIRDAQIKEKQLIQEQLEAEEKRLDAMMEQSRQKGIKAEEDKQKAESEKISKFVSQIQQQMKENELQKLVELERIEEESRLMKKAMIAAEKEEEEKRQKRFLAQRKTQEEMRKANEEMEHFKRIRAEEERIAEMRVKEFMRKKQEREAQREAEQAQMKAAKDQEIAMLLATQQKALDQKGLLDEANARRVQEEMEKKWREEAKEEARKKKAQNEELQKGRKVQIEQIRKAQALELEREERQFHEVAKIQKQQYEKEQEERNKKRMETIIHRKELLKQINEKERERINLHQAKFREGEALRLEHELRELKVKETMLKKIEDMRANKIPEIYISDIQRQFKLI